MSVIRLQGDTERRKGIYYQLDSNDEPIGVGGMGQVFKGLCVNEQTRATRPVAIKFMYDDLPAHVIERARREASIQLRNDNLVEMLGFIEIKEQTQYGETRIHYHVVSELLTGVSLSDLLEGKTTDRNGEETPFAVKLLQDYKNDSEHFARTIVMNVLSGLMALHDAGYIHRDIDPTNIMLTNDGHIKLIDFGIAKQMNTLTTNDKGLTVAGKFMGKPEYAAPELALGDIQHQNQTTDIYAVGILLYQCIVGHTPFEGPRHEILENQLKTKLPLNVIKNKALKRIIATACEKRQELRYQTSAQMRVALETMDSTPIGLQNNTKLFIGIAAALAVLLVGGGIMLLGRGGQQEPSQTIVIAQQPELTGIAKAANLLKEPSTAQEGFDQLNTMANQKDADAIFLLSRLYFKSKSASDMISDSIRAMQKALDIAVDYNKAHELLLKTVEINPENYYALYELGCDYLGGEARTDAVERDIEKADKYFKAALKYAEKGNDADYMERIQLQIDKYQ